MTRPGGWRDGWRAPLNGGVAHYFEATGGGSACRTLCGKVRRETSYLHPFAGVTADWRPCRDCWKRRPRRRQPPSADGDGGGGEAP